LAVMMDFQIGDRSAHQDYPQDLTFDRFSKMGGHPTVARDPVLMDEYDLAGRVVKAFEFFDSPRTGRYAFNELGRIALEGYIWQRCQPVGVN
jgi:hypothetical protein